MKTPFISVLIVILCLTISCDPVSTKPKIQNSSGISILVNYGKDTLPPESINPEKYFLANRIRPNELGNLHIIGGDKEWEYYIASSINKKLNVFIFPIDTIVKYGYAKSSKEKKFERLSYTQSQLDSINWVIIYK